MFVPQEGSPFQGTLDLLILKTLSELKCSDCV
jgi:hypothetical protein